MSDMVTFPKTWEEYEQFYGITDTDEVYTNGARLIPSFRVKQWLDHLPSAEPERKMSRWGYMLIDGSIMCLNCGTRYDWDSQAQYYKYCPNCGSRMLEEGGEKNETN